MRLLTPAFGFHHDAPIPLAASASNAASATASPSPSPTLDVARTPCLVDPTQLYCRVRDLTGSEWLASSSDWLIAKPARILLILIIAVAARWLLNRIISRIARRASAGSMPGFLAQGPAASFLALNPLASERRKQRAETMASVLRSVVTGVVFGIAFIMILAEVGLNIGPLLASAGILGVALGFGSQTLVKDFLSGIFMILEDQYGVGDVVDVGAASGSVESVGLRVTRIRSVDGAVWYVRNGEILRVGNMSQGWARAVLDVPVSYGSDLEKVRSVLEETAKQLYEDPQFRDLVLEEPEVWGVEALSSEAIVVRAVIKTEPLKQWDVARAMRQRITAAFSRAGIEMPYPQRAILMRTEGPGRERGAPADAKDGTVAPA